jgi:hypothetical protein
VAPRDLFFIAIFAALVLLVVLLDCVAMARHVKSVLRFGLAVAAIAVAFERRSWRGLALLIGAVAAVELGRLTRRRVHARV